MAKTMQKTAKKPVKKAQLGTIVKGAVKYGKQAIKGAKQLYDDAAKKMAGYKNTDNLRRSEDWQQYNRDIRSAKNVIKGAAATGAAGAAAVANKKKKALGGSSMMGNTESMRMLNPDNPRKRARQQARQRRQLRNQKRTKGCRGSRKSMFGSSGSGSGDMC